MATELSELSVVDLYADNSEMLSFLETSSKILCEESDKWKLVIHSHIDKVLQSKKFLKIETFGTGLDWLNTTKPLRLEELKNRVIVLDFFTYCCINCEHALPFLQEVEVKFDKDPAFLIIGVHSPKFPNEKSLDSVKNAVLRNKIKHPVINDPENSLWNKLGVYCWPTVLILSPDHRVLFSLVGEMQIEKISYLCGLTIDYFKMNNINLNKTQLTLNKLDSDSSMDTLLYPSGISTDNFGIMVSDTGHNRLLLLSYDGVVLDIIGNGKSGCQDGSFAYSSFDRPHGTAWWNANFVFVADTGNHSIRMIDLKAKWVTTIFSSQVVTDSNADSNENVSGFASPWDVCLGPKLGQDNFELNVLYIAVAGSHQIWAVNLEHTIFSTEQYSLLKFTPFAGTGNEECRNNVYRMKAGFAQPSGIIYSNGSLFVADSESSAVRSINLIDGSVKVLVGGGLDPKDLFKFGDMDGVSYNVKLQHPLGICVHEDGRLFFTDTYNHKIKLIEPQTKECVTVAGSGTKGYNRKESLKESKFNEPSAICYSSQKKGFFVVDTNNHCIKFFNPDMKVIKLLSLKFKNSSCIDGPPSVNTGYEVACKNLKTIKINLGFGGKINCCFKFLQDLTPTNNDFQPWDLSLKGDCNWKVTFMSNNLFDQSVQPSLILKCNDADSKVHHSEVIISANFSVCDKIHNICLPKKCFFMLDVEISSSGVDSYNGVFLL